MKPSNPMDHRRRFLRRLGVLALTALLPAFRPLIAIAAPPEKATPEDDWGPFYPPDWRGEIDADLSRFAGRSAEGTLLRLRGTVRGASGKVDRALADAVVELWQTDARGRYRHPGVPEHLRDPGFQGFGRTLTDARGRYEFLTIVPGRYGSRPPHLHIRVARPGLREWVSQIYFSGDNREAGVDSVMPPEREQLTVSARPEGDGVLAARFDIVLPQQR